MLEQEFTRLTTNEKSLLNFREQLSEISSHINELFLTTVDMYKACAGKQRPVVAWFCGKPNRGKTEVAQRMVRELAERENSHVYTRTYTDEYWSGYRGQAAVFFDDMAQRTDMKDVLELHSYSSSEARDVIGAAIEDKGRPFTSKYFFVTSNLNWIADPAPVNEKLAMNRRRDLVIYCHNPAVDDFMAEHNGNLPDTKEFFERHPTRYYLINPTFGHNLTHSNQQSLLKFSPQAPWVIREVSYGEIRECVFNLQLQRKEYFRQKLLTIKGLKYPVPTTPIVYDERKLIHSIASGESTTPSIASVDDIVLLPVKISEYIDAEDEINAVFKEYFAVMPPVYKLGMCSADLLHSEILRACAARGQPAIICDGGYIIAANGYNTSTNQAIERLVNNYPFEPGTIVFDISETMFQCVSLRHGVINKGQQNNPIQRDVEQCRDPSILILGPPGLGKSTIIRARLPDAYYATYEEGEVFPTNRPIVLDDFTTSPDRCELARKLVGDRYDRGMYQMILLSGNPETEPWKDMALDAKDMLTRRCHSIDFDYVTSVKLHASFKRISCAEYL
jgi:hypothetical protein